MRCAFHWTDAEIGELTLRQAWLIMHAEADEGERRSLPPSEAIAYGARRRTERDRHFQQFVEELKR